MLLIMFFSLRLLVLSIFSVNAATAHDSGSTSTVDLGTTLVAIKFKNGLVVAADSRTSVSGYVSHRFAHKITFVSEDCVILRSGSAADTQEVASMAQRVFSLRNYRHGLRPRVSQIANWIRSVVYVGEGTVNLLVAGIDKQINCARIYSISQNGALMEHPLFSAAGSGSTYITGYLDRRIRDELTDEESAIDACREAVELAISRDGSSGGLIRIVVLTKDRRRALSFASCANKEGLKTALSGFADSESKDIVHQ